MKHLVFALALTLAASLGSGSAFAADVASAWVQQLRTEGYRDIKIGRTWLGRTRIVAEKGVVEREIIINTRTGEVLRDYSRDEHGGARLPFGTEDDHVDDAPAPDESVDHEDDHEDEADDHEDEADDHEDEADDHEDEADD